MNLADTGRSIISDMFRWGYIKENSYYSTLDLRSMSNNEVINTIGKMFEDGYIGYGLEEFDGYYVSAELLDQFLAR